MKIEENGKKVYTSNYHKLGVHKIIKEILTNSVISQEDQFQGIYFTQNLKPKSVQ